MVGRERQAGDSESCWLGLGYPSGYQRTIPADGDNNLGFALFGMRANHDRPEMLPIAMCFMSSEKQCMGCIGKYTKKLVIVSEEVEFQ